MKMRRGKGIQARSTNHDKMKVQSEKNVQNNGPRTVM